MMFANNKKEKRAVIYCRVSTKEQVDEGNSLSTQERLCREYAIKQNYTVVKIYIEQGESAKTRDRTQLQNLLSFCAIKKNNIEAVIAYKIDRISRNLDDYSYIRILLKKYGVEIKSTSEHFENTPAGRFMENIIANVAQFDNDVRAERSIGGMREAMREGRYVWHAPIGYDNAKVESKSTIVPNSYALMIKEAFLLVGQNKNSVNEIRNSIIKSNLNFESKHISRAQFYKLLKLEVYAGWINKFGEKHKGKFTPLISEELFNHVQHVLKSRSHGPKFYTIENPDFPLRRFVFHPEGFKLTGSWSKGKTKRYAYYHFWRIKGLFFGKEYLEEKFAAFMNDFRLSGKHYEKLKELTKKHFLLRWKETEIKAEVIKKEIDDLKKEQDAYAQKSILGILSDEIVKRKIIELDDQIRIVTEKSLRLPVQSARIKDLVNLIHLFLENPGDVWKMASIKRKIALQWFQFPQGVTFSDETFGTQEICSLYMLKDIISGGDVSYCGPPIPHLESRKRAISGNKQNKPLSIDDPRLWDMALKDAQKLYEILYGKEEDPEDELLNML